jgi:UDP-glucuronate 4-epimerase
MGHTDALSGRTFLVTGGAGFIGSHVTRALLARGSRVLVIDDFNDFYDPRLKEENLRPLRGDPNLLVQRADIRDQAAVRSLVASHAAALAEGGILHLAARAGVRPSLKEPRLYLETNVVGTLNLAEAAREYGVRRFVFASSSSVYGERSVDGGPFREDQDVSKPVSPYASTKVMGENLLHSYSHLFGLRVVALRFFTVYGPAQRPDLAIRKFTRLIDLGQPVPVFGDGSTRRDYTYIDDIVQGVLAALHYEGSGFEVFNLGESHTVPLARLIELISATLGKPALIERLPLQPGDVPLTYADVSKAQRLLGYVPTTPIEEGIRRFVAWHREQPSAVAS